MSAGTLGSSSPAAAVYQSVYQAPQAKSPTINVRVINRDPANPCRIRLAICPAAYVFGGGAAPANADYIEPVDLVVPAGGVLEDTGIVISQYETVVFYNDTGNATCRVFGYEE